jgi:hypothetical protein
LEESQAADKTALQAQIDELKLASVNVDLVSAKADLGAQEIEFLKSLLGIQVDADGNLINPGDVALTGNLSAKGIVAGAMSIKNGDLESKTIGKDVITKVRVDANDDGIDDETGSNGKDVIVKTKAVNSDSRIFVSPEADEALTTPLTVTDKKAGESFKVSIPDPAKADIDFNWWIVEEK